MTHSNTRTIFGIAAALFVFACNGDQQGEQKAAPNIQARKAAPEPAPLGAGAPAQGEKPPTPSAPGGLPPSPGAAGKAPPGSPPGAVPSKGAEPGAADSAGVSPEQLDRFVRALTEVREVRAEFSPKITSADNTEQAQALQQQATQKIAERLKKIGMTVSEYEKLANKVNADPQLQAKLQARLEEAN